jgi:hypothetical protein
MEDRWGVEGENEGLKEADRQTNLVNRAGLWEMLREEIAEQLPGDKELREERAEEVLQRVLRLEGEGGGRGETEVGKSVVEDKGVGIEVADREPQVAAVAASSSSDHETSEEDD